MQFSYIDEKKVFNALRSFWYVFTMFDPEASGLHNKTVFYCALGGLGGDRVEKNALS